MLSRRALGGAAGAIVGGPTAAQPAARPVRLIVPFPPGGAVDILGRLLGERLGPALGTSVIVENRGGAGGNIGADAVAKSTPDGTTLGVIGVSTLCAAAALYRSLPFDPTRDFLPVTMVTTGSLLCVVNAETAAKQGWTDFAALIAWARANPDGVRMGSSGTGTTSHLLIAAVNRATGARILHVPYRGGAPAISDLLAGTIDMMFDVMPALMPHVTAGRFKPLAVSSAGRVDILPAVPGMADLGALGLGNLDLQTWNAIVGPRGIPEPAVIRIGDAVRTVAVEPEFRERLRPLGYAVRTSADPGELARLIAQETPFWHRLVRESGAQLD